MATSLHFSEKFATYAAFTRYSLVLATAAASSYLTRGVLNPKEGSRYTQKFPPSPFQPPGWVFGVVWMYLYILYALAWAVSYAYAKRLPLPENPDQVAKEIDFLFSLGLILKLGWSLFIFAAEKDKLPLAVGYWLANLTLLVLIITKLNSVSHFYDNNHDVHKTYAETQGHTVMLHGTDHWIMILFYYSYIGWISIALFLSLTSDTE
jgi:tryptophan-rich sensory protein